MTGDGGLKVESFDFGFGIVDAEWGKRAESLKLKAESRGQKTEFGMRNGEGGIKRRWGEQSDGGVVDTGGVGD